MRRREEEGRKGQKRRFGRGREGRGERGRRLRHEGFPVPDSSPSYFR